MVDLLCLGMDERTRAFCSNRFFFQKRDNGVTVRVLIGHGVNLAQFVGGPRWHSKEVVEAVATLVLMTQVHGSMPARRKSAWRLAASSTGIVSANVTISTLVCFGSCNCIIGVVKCMPVLPI